MATLILSPIQCMTNKELGIHETLALTLVYKDQRLIGLTSNAIVYQPIIHIPSCLTFLGHLLVSFLTPPK